MDEIERQTCTERDRDDVEPLIFSLVQAVVDVQNVFAAVDYPLAMQKTERQLEIVAGCAHGDRDALALGPAVRLPEETDLHRLFGGQDVVAAIPGMVVNPDDGMRYLNGRLIHRHRCAPPSHRLHGSGRTGSRSGP